MTPSTDTITGGTTVTLTCDTASNGVTYYHMRDGNTRIDTENEGTHVMKDVTSADSGLYTCYVRTEKSMVSHSDGHTLTVVGEYKIRKS